MKPQAGQTKSPARPGAKLEAADGKDDLKTLLMAEVEKRLQCTLDGLTQAEAVQRLAKYGPNEI